MNQLLPYCFWAAISFSQPVDAITRDNELRWTAKIASEFVASALGQSPQDAKRFLTSPFGHTPKESRNTMGFLSKLAEGRFHNPLITSQEIAPSGNEVLVYGVLMGKKENPDADFSIWLVRDSKVGVWGVRFAKVVERMEGSSKTRIPLSVLFEDYMDKIVAEKSFDFLDVTEQAVARRILSSRKVRSLPIAAKDVTTIKQNSFLTNLLVIAYLRNYSSGYVTVGARAGKAKDQIDGLIGPTFFPNQDVGNLEIVGFGRISSVKITPTFADDEYDHRKKIAWCRININITYSLDVLKEQNWNVCPDTKKYGVWIGKNFDIEGGKVLVQTVGDGNPIGFWDWRRRNWEPIVGR